MSDGDWTYARNAETDPRPGEFLFDRTVDPGENVNLIDREPEQAERMLRLLNEHLAQQAAGKVLETDVRIDPGIAQRLRALGYLR